MNGTSTRDEGAPGSILLDSTRNSFNAVRLLAALQVVYMHSVGHLELPRGAVFELASQWPGVPAFFALSGFLVMHSFVQRSSLASFASARALRIYPALAVNVFLLEILFSLGGGSDWQGRGLLQMLGYEAIYMATASSEIAAHVLGLSGIWNFSGFFRDYPSGVLWTLTVEISFYIALLVLGLTSRSRLGATAVFFAGAIFSLLYLQETASQVANGEALLRYSYLTILPYFWMFSLGVLMRIWIHVIERSLIWLLLATLGVWLGLSYWSGFSWIDWKYQFNPIDLLKTSMVCISAVLLGLGGWAKVGWIRRNDISYGVYLWHMLVVSTLVSLQVKGSWWFLVVLSATLLLAMASWFCVERPCIRLRKRKLARPAETLKVEPLA